MSISCPSVVHQLSINLIVNFATQLIKHNHLSKHKRNCVNKKIIKIEKKFDLLKNETTNLKNENKNIKNENKNLKNEIKILKKENKDSDIILQN